MFFLLRFSRLFEGITVFLVGIILLLAAATSYAGQGFTKTVEGRTTTFMQNVDKVFNRVESYNVGVDESHTYIPALIIVSVMTLPVAEGFSLPFLMEV